MGLYDRQIESLELLIHNWYDIKSREDFLVGYDEIGD